MTAVRISAAVLLLAASPAAAQEHCTPAVTAEVRRLGVDPATIGEIVYGRIYSTGEGADLIGHHAWVGFETCAGNLVIELDLGCRMRNRYTRKECRIAGIDHSC